MDLGLQGKVALVTAATAGLGLATAWELIQEGAKVMICGRDPDRLTHALTQLGQAGKSEQVRGRVADVAHPTEIEPLVQACISEFGQLDILITNAGGPPAGNFTGLDFAAWETAIELTLMSHVRLIKAALPYLQQSDAAAILTITSVSAKQPISGLLLSNVLRPAVLGLTKSLSQELAPTIRVNSILPGWTETERVSSLLAYRAQQNQTTVEQERASRAQTIPLGRIARPEEFGKVAAFMVSAAASYLNGVMLQVDGGSYSGLL
ncbi:MAG: SDR family oxidoreductase [Anaerolineae bacterium]|nr:SDR family oxidoreductase [Anaerolineae bacterium]